MKQYVIDQLNDHDRDKLTSYLDEHLHRPTVEGIYWLFLDPSVLSGTQRAHTDCGRFYVALEMEADRLVCELLVRAEQRIRCACIRYATAEQCRWVIGIIDAILDKLAISP